ncbi:Stp1/IreP family PP2C-type Ser/Thr phosphatase [Beggiatoa leptomitoformis]|uniref:Stp1/IreP family PP2C-type Ser/Thr phosphatase n=1 Tax=Beggiatoa leptomitoformis TaxID=288004 RepID=A0A2N9YD74_9GAMM|nr:Stp1/IreP family PP2C-type Ser/Thr phosphatase [Beggiatoa leptomitoformis]ALG69180.1 Stp1/IreP family PP2C-type Ser/Thr phosphatase [Beggiatoa leptomitoformis]AUI68394.1 Stp1/IreP family PP2C-type Ser/Thr phosphatase [Beggiatoa leptomitoformis]
MHLEIACQSDTGLVREHNEDCIDSDTELGIVVLADGMGGYQAGEVASELAVKTIMQDMAVEMRNLSLEQQQTLTANGQHRISALLEKAIIKANQLIYSTAEQQLEYRGMGTTVVAAIFQPTFVSVAHVGDSRLYRLRGSEFIQLTTDHSVLQELIDCGFYTREQARYSPNKNLVTRALGVGDSVTVDVKEYPITSNDIYLLCSDGLNDMLDDEVMQKILLRDNNLEQKARFLVERANKMGGEDNISVILAQPMFATNNDITEPKTWMNRLSSWWR